MKRRTLFTVTLAAGLGLAFNVHAATQWDLAAAYPAFNFHSQNLEQFSKDVSAATQGNVNITVHAGASLFKMPEIKRAVQGGQAQAGEFFMVSFQNEWPLFGLDGLPFLASNYDEAWKLYQAQRPALEKKLDQQGIKLLYAVAWPPQSIYSNKPINSVEDLKGMKWRVYSPTTARIGELVGAQPVTIQEAELTQALATGVIEGLITSSATGADNKLYEQMKYFTNVQAWIPKNAVVVNKKAFEALPKAEQDGILKAAADAEVRGWAASRQVDADSIAKLKAGGMQVIEPSDELRAGLAKIGDVVIEEWTTTAGDEGKQVLADYRANK
ncbi:TRAP transporter substrate-binding protein [Castellaniella sp.]|uniref:TRAP transporter substrate-binding protein n=1 Tax=Castellaniella sp. TaxID=1955812 RepID=UPI002AFFDEAE|nr:TRAP transporter substrate-binding protein [Castellaniella sp.]